MYKLPESSLDNALISVPKHIILRVYMEQGFKPPRILNPSGQLDVGRHTGLGS
jgi:hypothetical protein